MKPSPPFTAAALFCVCSLLSPRAVSPQDFSSIAGDLTELENLIQDTLRNSGEQQKQLEDLRKTIAEIEVLIGTCESVIAEREDLLRNLQCSARSLAAGRRLGLRNVRRNTILIFLKNIDKKQKNGKMNYKIIWRQ
jgi:septal ring factor EnvC (AmiA/AmiB activator)